MNKPSLSSSQRKIVEASDGPFLVIASAGSGKTRILTERVRYLLQEKKIKSRVLALTFTNKAAAEMRERLSHIEELPERAYIGTIHSFCQSIIQSYGQLIGYNFTPSILERESDQIALLEEVFLENAELKQLLNFYTSKEERRKYLYGVHTKISGWKRSLADYEALLAGSWPHDHEAMVFRAYNERLALQGAIDFDDILLIAYRILSERPNAAGIYQRTYRYICVDEAQDLNSVQYAVVKILSEASQNLLMVGDPNQAIYGFNGSSKRYMIEQFPLDFKNTSIVTLKENFRSSKAVIRAANSLYPDSVDIGSAVMEGAIEVVACGDEIIETKWIAEKIKNLLAAPENPQIDGAIEPSKFAVLARNRYVFAPLESALKAEGIDFHVRQPAGSSLESEFGKVFDLGLRILVNPRDRLHLRELYTRIGIVAAAEPEASDSLPILQNLVNLAPLNWSSAITSLSGAWQALAGDINYFSRTIDGLILFLRSFLPTKPEDLDGHEAALAIQDLEFLNQAWLNYTRQVSRESRSLSHFRNQMSMGVTNSNTEGRGVTLATVHAVKGLEFDIVFLMGLVEGGFPDYRAVKSGGSALAEEKNDAFVAVTRAKRFLYLTWPRAKFMPWDKERRVVQVRSRFLNSILTTIQETAL